MVKLENESKAETYKYFDVGQYNDYTSIAEGVLSDADVKDATTESGAALHGVPDNLQAGTLHDPLLEEPLVEE